MAKMTEAQKQALARGREKLKAKRALNKELKAAEKLSKKNPSPPPKNAAASPGGPEISPYPAMGENPNFERLARAAAAGGDNQDKQRGGARPGAGRPKGATEQKVLTDRLLNSQPNPLYKQGVKLPFKYWANSQDLKKLELSEAEADAINEPLSQLVEYLMPQVVKNPALASAINLLIALSFPLAERLGLLWEIRKQRQGGATHKEAEPKSGGAGPAGNQHKPPQFISPKRI